VPISLVPAGGVELVVEPSIDSSPPHPAPANVAAAMIAISSHLTARS
jgi:hypothetical protein